MTAGSPDYYGVLQVSSSASQKDIKKAYYALAMKFHPDKNPSGNQQACEEQFKRIKAAYEVLSQENSRTMYDASLRQQQPQPPPPQQQQQQQQQQQKQPEYKFKFWNGESHSYSEREQQQAKPEQRSPRDSKKKPAPPRKPPWDGGFAYPDSKSRGPPDKPSGSGKENAESYAKWREAFQAYFRRNFGEDPPASDPEEDSEDSEDDGEDSGEEDLRHADPSQFRNFEEFAKWRHNHSKPAKGPEGAKSFRFWFGDEEAGQQTRTKFGPGRTANDAFVKCKFCHSMMNVEELVNHEPSCEHRRKPKAPSAPWTAETDAAEEAASWHQQFGAAGDTRGLRDWRDAHASTQSSIRRDRMRMAAAGGSAASPFHFGSTLGGFADDFEDDECCGELDHMRVPENPSLFRCPVCLRTFVRRQIADHVTGCRQQQQAQSRRRYGNETGVGSSRGSREPRPAHHGASRRSDSSKLPDIGASASATTANAGSGGASQQRRAGDQRRPQQRPSAGSRRGSVPTQQQEEKLNVNFSERIHAAETSGCPNCRQRFGRNARYACSCGFKTTTANKA